MTGSETLPQRQSFFIIKINSVWRHVCYSSEDLYLVKENVCCTVSCEICRKYALIGREAAKKVIFSGRTTKKRGGGFMTLVVGPLKKIFFCGFPKRLHTFPVICKSPLKVVYNYVRNMPLSAALNSISLT